MNNVTQPFGRQAQYGLRGANFEFGIVRLWHPFIGVDSVTGNSATVVGTRVNKATPYGQAFRSTAAGGNILNLSDGIVLNNWTVFWYGIPTTVGNSGTAEVLFSSEDFGETDISAGRDGWVFYNQQSLSTTGLAEAYVAGTGNVAASMGLVAAVPNTVVMSRNGTTVTCYVNGVSKGTIAVGSGDGRTYQFHRLGAHRFSGSNQQVSGADHLLYGIAGIPWSQARAYEFARNPWSVLPHLPRRLYLGVAAAATSGQRIFGGGWGGRVIAQMKEAA